MAKELGHIRLQGGCNRLKNGPADRPFRLENCEMQINGFVRAVNQPSTNDAETAESKPYVEWNGDILDRSSYSTLAGGTQITATALADAKMNARLYRSVQSEDAGLDPNYRVVKFNSDWVDTSPNDSWQPQPAVVYASSFSLQDPTDYSFVTAVNAPADDVQEDIHAGYVAIPYDSNGEAGPWFHFTVLRHVDQLDSTGINFVGRADITLSCNEFTQRVDIYRTMDLDNRGFVHGGPKELTEIADGNAEVRLDQQVDHGYYYFGSFNGATNTSTSQREVQFSDDEVWVTPVILEVIKSDLGVSSTSGDLRDRVTRMLLNTYPFTKASNDIVAPDTTLTIGRNHHSTHADPFTFNSYQYRPREGGERARLPRARNL